MRMSESVVLDIRVNSYQGAPTRLVATINVATGQVYVSSEKPFKPESRQRSILEMIKLKRIERRTLIITDSSDALQKWDMLFNEQDHLTAVIRAYHEKMRNGLIKIHADVQGRYNPESVLQQRKLDVQKGAVWELSTETQNGHVCILLACWAAVRSAATHSFSNQIHQQDQDYSKESDSDDLDEPFSI